MPLLNPKTVTNALAAFRRSPSVQEVEAARNWAVRAGATDFSLQNESQLEQEFNRALIQDVLGYAAPGPGMPGTMRVKQPVPGGTVVDVALGHFGEDGDRIIAPLELKGPKTALDRIMPGRSKTPVQQAWDYAMDAPGARWVLLSNMREMRLYAFGHGRLDYERFDLARLHEEAELRRFQMLLHADQLLGGATESLLARSAAADRDITDKLYAQYKDVRGRLMQFVADQHPAITPDRRIRLVQTLLDRLLFIAFAEDTFLLPEKSLHEAISVTNKYAPTPKWHQLRTLFQWVDKGAAEHNIPPYNGGLFAADADIDALDLPDHLVESFAFLGQYDFRSDVSVTILGHIFEQSISDIEGLRAEARQAPAPTAGKKKREGVVYTPDFVTRFIVERTIGRHLKDIRDGLIPAFGKIADSGDIRWRNKTTSERDFWQAYLDRLTALRVLDPACGSGAFLIAAFDHLHDEQRRVRARLGELAPGLLILADENTDVDIITNNLFGVDVNAESVEITKLALWLKTAKRERRLESLDANIKWGNSLIDSADVHPRPFDWAAEFPTILTGEADQGFDIVLGNPPYVRMELLKEIKPYLQANYAVAADRADLYAYFFELAVRVLKPGGRLGFISSSSFFRTGSGAALRGFLSSHAQIEAVVDFGDLQVFEGVTTYPAIITLRKGDAAQADEASPDLTYLNVRAMPDDLSKAFETQALAMPRDRLTSATWRFETDLLDAIRAKMAKGRPTLAEVYGAPLYGIKTGLNAAFVLTHDQRDAIVARAARTGDRSADLLKPFLIGENLKRWHIESDDLWLIYTPRNAIDIEDYPALSDHLATHRERLEARATNQNWWELQQAQANYEPHFNAAKIIYPHFNDKPNFSFDPNGFYSNDKSYIIPCASPALAAFLNSKLSWFQLCGLAPAVRGGFREARVQYIGALAVVGRETVDRELGSAAKIATDSADALFTLRNSVVHRLGDIATTASQIAPLMNWPTLTFPELQALLLKRARVTIPLRDRDEWERWYDGKRAEAAILSARIAAAEAEIDARVYRLFDLTPTEIDAVEDALAIASPALSLKAYEAISAVEGLALSPEARDRLASHGAAGRPRADAA